ncbi:RNA polymerase sigma factor [Fusibacter bizertensis]|uniref:RNA polymerase sigma factor n=1 Tax=Fusibacter bizertensis TaxID=1488331 RepID=A0ABT6NEH3_9FIRM|nr:RNA polymerase sigma factor [Fusibacter bizertensis]MDH8678832.1 RNA polymerase sigma factor [Fusibacter bizertensis]
MSRDALYKYFAKEGKKLELFVKSRIRSISEMDAEDIVDEVMLNLLSVIGLNGQIENIPAYVTRSLQYKIIDYYRLQNRTKSLHTSLSSDSTLALMDVLASHIDIASDFEQKEFVRSLFTALDSLTPKQRAIFIATELEGKTFRELSEQWNEPIGTLLSRKSRTIKLLKEKLTLFDPKGGNI